MKPIRITQLSDFDAETLVLRYLEDFGCNGSDRYALADRMSLCDVKLGPAEIHGALERCLVLLDAEKVGDTVYRITPKGKARVGSHRQ